MIKDYFQQLAINSCASTEIDLTAVTLFIRVTYQQNMTLEGSKNN